MVAAGTCLRPHDFIPLRCDGQQLHNVCLRWHPSFSQSNNYNLDLYLTNLKFNKIKNICIWIDNLTALLLTPDSPIYTAIVLIVPLFACMDASLMYGYINLNIWVCWTARGWHDFSLAQTQPSPLCTKPVPNPTQSPFRASALGVARYIPVLFSPYFS
jgi:hypothetical protein